ncbi:MAG: hypothetical protein JSV53_01510 [candidate division WOR-3 bacterium]|nr:MAG: hypothetical protein JSV53_01510 [candidate division WOR-3 bacterium]
MNELDFSEIAKLNEKYNKDPRSRIFVQLADSYRKSNMIDEALDVLNKGLEYHPQYPVAYLVQGKCYFDKRAYIQARDAFEKTIGYDPQNIVALRMLAKTCEILKDEKGQISAYKNIISIDPLDTHAKEKLSMLEALQRKEPLYTVAMAEEYEKQGKLEESLKIYENLLYTDPSDLILKQKVAEVKKKIREEKLKMEGEKIEEMQVEPVFKPTELAESAPVEEKTTPSPDKKEQAAATASEEGIQSLEDFLVEELEQAAEKVAAESIDEAPSEEPSPAVQEPPKPEPIVLTDESEGKIEEPIKEVPVTPAPEQKQDETDEAVELSFGKITLDKEATPEIQNARVEQEKQPPTVSEEAPTPVEISEPKAEAPKPEIIAQPPPETKDETLPQEAEPPEKTTAPEEKIEEKKPKEEDFKSFQDWLSGLLK